MLGKQDQLLDKQDQILNLQSKTVDEIKGLRGDMRTHFYSESEKIKKKLRSIEDALERAGINVSFLTR
jgi:hypothetical protein